MLNSRSKPKMYHCTINILKDGNRYKLTYDSTELDLINKEWFVVNGVVLLKKEDLSYRLRDVVAYRMHPYAGLSSVYHLNKNKFDFRRKNLVSLIAGGFHVSNYPLQGF